MKPSNSSRAVPVYSNVSPKLGVGPQETPDVGGQPEPVDAERKHQQHAAANQQVPEKARLSDETHGPAGRGASPACAAGTVASKVMSGLVTLATAPHHSPSVGAVARPAHCQA